MIRRSYDITKMAKFDWGGARQPVASSCAARVRGICASVSRNRSCSARLQPRIGGTSSHRAGFLVAQNFRRERGSIVMNGIIYIVGLVVVVLAILSFLGLRW